MSSFVKKTKQQNQKNKIWSGLWQRFLEGHKRTNNYSDFFGIADTVSQTINTKASP